MGKERGKKEEKRKERDKKSLRSFAIKASAWRQGVLPADLIKPLKYRKHS